MVQLSPEEERQVCFGLREGLCRRCGIALIGLVKVLLNCCAGLLLIELLELISGETFPAKYEKNPNIRIKKVGNVGQALKFIESKGIKLAGIGPEGVHSQSSAMPSICFLCLVQRSSTAI